MHVAGKAMARGFAVVACVVVVTTTLFVSAAGAHGARSAVTALTWRNLYDWPHGHGYVGWHSSTTAGDDYGLAAALGGQPGLWLWPAGGKKTYDTADYAQWSYTAPGTTRITSAQLDYEWNNKLLAHHCVDVGLRDGSGAVLTQREICKPPPQSPLSLVLRDDAASAKVLFFSIHVDCGGEETCSRSIPSKSPLAQGAYARLLDVDMTLVDDDLPTLAPAGPLYDLRDTYINGTQTYGVTVHADDAGSGIKSASLGRNGFADPTGTLVSRDAPCDPTHHTPALDARICPASFEYPTTVDSTTLAEGTSHFAEGAVDYSGQVGTSDEWKIYVDRTPPTVPQNLNLVSFTSAGGGIVVGWDPSDDPDLPDGAPGSGISHYDVRYQLNGGDWVGWTSQPDVALAIDGGNPGDVLTFEVKAVDNVGNTSDAATASFTLPQDEPTLASGDVATAQSTATADPRVASIIDGRPYSIVSTTPANGDGNMDATVTIAWDTPATIAADWPSTDVVAHYTAANVTGLNVTVDLDCNQVSLIEPDDGSYATDDPTYVSGPSAPCGSASDRVKADLSRLTNTTQATAATASWVHNVRPIHVGPDVFYNYDYADPSFSAELDWPVDLIFWNNAVTPDQVKSIYHFGSSIADPAYMNIAQGNGAIWDQDAGSKSGVPGCNTVEHYRVYKDDNASDTRFTTNWGFYIVGSSHLDRFEECKVPDPNPFCTPFPCFINVGDHWSGKSERAETIIAAAATTKWGPHSVQPNFVQLYNAETDHREGSHNHKWYINNGKATKIKVCIDRLGENTFCP
jgi:hypothetical protein